MLSNTRNLPVSSTADFELVGTAGRMAEEWPAVSRHAAAAAAADAVN